MRGTDAGGEGAGAGARDVYEFFVGSELVESGEQAFGLGEQLVVVVAFNLQEHVVHAEVVVAHGADEIGKVGGLAGEAFEDVDELGGAVVERVVEIGFVPFRALFVEQGFCAEVGEAAVNFQIHILKIIELGGERKDALRERRADFEWLGVRVIVELAYVVGAGAGLIDFDFDEFGVAGFENFAESDFGGAFRGCVGEAGEAVWCR